MNTTKQGSVRTIYCPGVERHVPLGMYLKGVRLAKANLTTEFKHGITCWWPCTGREIVRQFVKGIDDRINQAIPYLERGKRGAV